MLLFDFRQQKVIHAYRGFTGAIRQVVCHPSKPLIVSVGLDRFVRVHHLQQQTPLHKAYLKSRLNTVLIRQDFGLDDVNDADLCEENTGAEKDLFWNTMEVIKEPGFQEIEEQGDNEGDSSPTKSNGSKRKKRKSIP